MFGRATVSWCFAWQFVALQLLSSVGKTLQIKGSFSRVATWYEDVQAFRLPLEHRVLVPPKFDIPRSKSLQTRGVRQLQPRARNLKMFCQGDTLINQSVNEYLKKTDLCQKCQEDFLHVFQESAISESCFCDCLCNCNRLPGVLKGFSGWLNWIRWHQGRDTRCGWGDHIGNQPFRHRMAAPNWIGGPFNALNVYPTIWKKKLPNF